MRAIGRPAKPQSTQSLTPRPFHRRENFRAEFYRALDRTSLRAGFIRGPHELSRAVSARFITGPTVACKVTVYTDHVKQFVFSSDIRAFKTRLAR